MEKKQYQTQGKLSLVRYLKSVSTLPPQSAEQIYQGMLNQNTDAPGRSSVYRMLSALCESGQVQRFPDRSGEHSFVYQYVGGTHDCESHLHLHCLSCGEVMHLECSCSDTLTSHLLSSHGFLVNRGRSVLYGTCAACAAKEDR